MNTSKQKLREEIEDIFNYIARDQRSLLNSIRKNINEVPDTKVELKELKARINEEFHTQNWYLK